MSLGLLPVGGFAVTCGKLRLMFGLRRGPGMSPNRVVVREITLSALAISSVCLLALVTMVADSAIENATSNARAAQERATLVERNLLGCLNGSYTGVYYFRGDKRVDIVCDKPAFEIVEQ